MLEKFALAIEEAAADWCLDLEQRSDYVGRGMAGHTAGIVGEHNDIIKAIAVTAAKYAQLSAAIASESALIDDCNSKNDDLEDFLIAVGEFRWDSMGRKQIVY